MKFVIDGLFLTQQITGIQRYAFEITSELDNLIEKDKIQILVPESANVDVNFENIDIIHFGKHKGIAWQQTDFCKYARKHHLQIVGFTNVLPLLYAKGIVVIHDVSYKANPHFFSSKRDRISVLWHRLLYWRAVHSKIKIVTVSEFSKSEICKYYKVDPQKITVVYNAWQHMSKVNAAEDTFERYPQLKNKPYYFSMCTLAPNKNLKWILEMAKKNPENTFAIAGGGKMKSVIENEQGILPNVHFLGYISDENAKTLMANCEAFIFPTLYEGFGIPPLEAIACGAKNIFVSDTLCMREIYGNKVNLINLSSNDYFMTKNETYPNYDEILSKYSWKKSAAIIFNLLFNGD